MCNAYTIGSKRVKLELGIELEPIEPRLVRRTDPAPVVTDALELVTMRWGFERDGLGTINNTRAEKLDGRLWAKAFRERRCLVPARAFYEWSGPRGQKQTHRFTRPGEELLWIAGIWEPSRSHGRCFSMITTEANAVMAPIHPRMPAVLEPGQLAAYLAGEIATFVPSADNLQVEASPNPLLKPKEPPAQMELF